MSTICGMLPVAFGTGDGSEWRSPMGIISIGGLATSTFLTLLVVPVVYTLFDDAASFGARTTRLLTTRWQTWRSPLPEVGVPRFGSTTQSQAAP